MFHSLGACEQRNYMLPEANNRLTQDPTTALPRSLPHSTPRADPVTHSAPLTVFIESAVKTGPRVTFVAICSTELPWLVYRIRK